MIEDVIRKGRLLDIYGPLLTEKQRRCLDMYFNEDLSLSEIGDELSISRQGAYDMLNRASKALENYETRLSLLARSEQIRRDIDRAVELLDSQKSDSKREAVEILRKIDV